MSQSGADAAVLACPRIQSPASKLQHDGFERLSHVAFGPEGALYVTDFGEIDIAPEKAGIRVQAETGSLWRVVRDESAPLEGRPPRQTVVPFYLAQYLTWVAGLAAIVTGLGLLIRRSLRKQR